MKRAVLVIQTEGEEVRTHVLEAEETLIGRSGRSDVRLNDTGASREHALITWEEDHYAVEDLQSTNGTRVNGRRIRSSPLQGNDSIALGRTRIVFRLED